MANQFDRNHQRRKRGHRPSEMLQVADTGVLESLRLVIEKSAQCTAQRNNRHGGRRLEAGYHADQIAEKNEEKERRLKMRVNFPVGAQCPLCLSLSETFSPIHTPLYARAAC